MLIVNGKLVQHGKTTLTCPKCKNSKILMPGVYTSDILCPCSYIFMKINYVPTN